MIIFTSLPAFSVLWCIGKDAYGPPADEHSPILTITFLCVTSKGQKFPKSLIMTGIKVNSMPQRSSSSLPTFSGLRRSSIELHCEYLEDH
ncbi:hypothetical protein L218DRAFT_454966 [Marasmius fiardii PR-910]|nr:hypothetical protein L218DRAFT_454966 [Marasmius fiardii PR-910]